MVFWCITPQLVTGKCEFTGKTSDYLVSVDTIFIVEKPVKNDDSAAAALPDLGCHALSSRADAPATCRIQPACISQTGTRGSGHTCNTCGGAKRRRLGKNVENPSENECFQLWRATADNHLGIHVAHCDFGEVSASHCYHVDRNSDTRISSGHAGRTTGRPHEKLWQNGPE